MAKFGLYESGGAKATQEYEGDWLVMNGESVLVMVSDPSKGNHAVAAVRLAQGQSVKKVKE